MALPPPTNPPYVPGQPLVDCTAPQQRSASPTTRSTWAPASTASTPWPTHSTRESTGDELKNRLLLKEGLEQQGFINYDKEWWHFTYQPEPYPDTYFDFPVDRDSLTG